MRQQCLIGESSTSSDGGTTTTIRIDPSTLLAIIVRGTTTATRDIILTKCIVAQNPLASFRIIGEPILEKLSSTIFSHSFRGVSTKEAVFRNIVEEGWTVGGFMKGKGEWNNNDKDEEEKDAELHCSHIWMSERKLLLHCSHIWMRERKLLLSFLFFLFYLFTINSLNIHQN